MKIEKRYSLKEVSDILGVTKRSVYTYIYTGRLIASKATGRYTIAESDLNKFINDGKRTTFKDH